MPQMNFPDHIAHKPVFLVPYFSHDPGNEDDTDAQFLSIGWSQWDDEEPSAKVVRHSGERWSRQSEELPLGRLVDLTMLLVTAWGEGQNFTTLSEGILENQPLKIDVAFGSRRDREALISEIADDPILRRRLKALYARMRDLDRNGAFD